MSGSADEYMRGVHWFNKLETKPPWKFWVKQTHISDMLVLKEKKDEVIKLFECINYGYTGWETAPTVHYSNFAMKPKGYMPRHEWIPKLRSLGKI